MEYMEEKDVSPWSKRKAATLGFNKGNVDSMEAMEDKDVYPWLKRKAATLHVNKGNMDNTEDMEDTLSRTKTERFLS